MILNRSLFMYCWFIHFLNCVHIYLSTPGVKWFVSIYSLKNCVRINIYIYIYIYIYNIYTHTHIYKMSISNVSWNIYHILRIKTHNLYIYIYIYDKYLEVCIWLNIIIFCLFFFCLMFDFSFNFSLTNSGIKFAWSITIVLAHPNSFSGATSPKVEISYPQDFLSFNINLFARLL